MKALLGKTSPLAKIKTDLSPQKLNIITIAEVVKVIRALAKKGNEVANELVDALLEESMDRRFAKAFDQTTSEDEYNERIKVRMSGKVARRSVTDAVKDWLDRHPEVTGNRRKYLYANMTDQVYQLMFGVRAKEMRVYRQVPNSKLLRDGMTESELRHLEAIEDLTMRLIDKEGYEPVEAASEAVNALRLTSYHFLN